MILTDNELRDLYNSLVIPFQHPDPVGFMTRALLLSEGDPNFSEEGLVGFLPMPPKITTDETGVPEIQSLANNVTAGLAIDRLNFDKYGDVDVMVIATHFPGELNESGDLTKEQKDFLNDIEETREDVLFILEPPFATVDDVIEVLNASANTENLTANKKKFFNVLLSGRTK